jgi:autotransporter-associated beta strand protein
MVGGKRGIGTSTTFSGEITGSGSLTKMGTGPLVLNGSDSFLGGTSVDAGTLCLTGPDTLPDGSSLTIGDEQTLNSDATVGGEPAESPILVAPAASSGVVAVPEPPALVLLAAALGVCCGRRWQHGRRRLRRPGPQ